MYRVWQTQDGLPHNAVRTIVQDREGDLWVGTTAELVRFDGARFVTAFGTGEHDEVARLVRKILFTADNSLWLALSEGRIARMRRRSDPVFALRPIAGTRITALYQDMAGDIWIGTEQGLARWRNGEYKIYSRRDSVSALLATPQYGLLVGTNFGLMRLAGERGNLW